MASGTKRETFADMAKSDGETENRTRVVYFGTPEYAVPALRSLADDPRYEICLVVTQPDRPAGRGHALQEPPVKTAAREIGIPVYQPQSLRTPDLRQPLVDARAELFVVAAYGIIFGPKTLAIPRLGAINLHASLLPKYRGASPISAAILSGDDVAGVTLMEMEAGMDTGAMIAARSTPISMSDTTGTLTSRLAQVGAELLVETLQKYLAGGIAAVPQSVIGVSAVRPMTKADGWIDWSQSAGLIERQCRAMLPWPKCWTTLPDGKVMQVTGVSVAPNGVGAKGEVSIAHKRVLVACGSGILELVRVQIAGSAESDAASLINGRKLASGDLLGTSGAPEDQPQLIRTITPVEA